MSDLIIDNEFLYTDPITLKSYPAWMSQAVDQLLQHIRHKNIWEITDFCLSIWAKKYPEDHRKFLKETQTYRNSRKNEYGSTKDKTHRTLVAIPHEIDYLLHKIARHKLEEYGEDRWRREFARRYPGFRTAEKI